MIRNPLQGSVSVNKVDSVFWLKLPDVSLNEATFRHRNPRLFQHRRRIIDTHNPGQRPALM
ncbi:hypothetical protein D3C72_2512980 [compost metagenome]